VVQILPDGTPYFARFNPNPHFAPEQLNGSELGYRRLLGEKLYVDLAGFYNHYHNLFSEDIIGPTFVETDPAPTHYLLPADFANGLLAYTKGFEIAPEWRPASFWRLRGSYSYLHMNVYRSPKDLQNVESPASVSGASPEQQVSVESALDLSKRLQLDLDFRYVSALPALAVPGYSTGDGRLGWRFNPQLELSLVGQNLLQPSHMEYGNVGIRRSVYARLTWSR
jgi:iron complex outermembrane receptor protein